MSFSNRQVNREIATLGVIISAMVYGAVAAFAITYIPLLLKTSHTISRRMRNFLLAYVTFMVASSTVYTITLIIAFTIGRNILEVGPPLASIDSMIGYIDLYSFFPNGIAGKLCITFTSWGADGFMLWRCAVLYQGISRPRQLATISILILMAIASVGFYLYFLVDQNGLLPQIITIITTTINIISASLIAARILYFQRYIGKTVGSKRNNHYTTIIIICIESSALIVFFSILWSALFMTQIPGSFILMHSLVHVNVISPLLMVYRVAMGRAVTSAPIRPEDGPAVSELHFASTRNNGNSASGVGIYSQGV